MEFCQKGCKLLAGEGPLKGNGDLLLAVWKGPQTLFHFLDAGFLIGREDELGGCNGLRFPRLSYGSRMRPAFSAKSG